MLESSRTDLDDDPIYSIHLICPKFPFQERAREACICLRPLPKPWRRRCWITTREWGNIKNTQERDQRQADP